MKQTIILIFVFTVTISNAQLTVTVSPVKVTGQKAVVPLAMKNNFAETVESAHAVCFLLNDQGKMVGQSTKWIIGGTKDRPGLPAGGANVFNFVITTDKLVTSTNLQTKVMFNRLILQGGKLANPIKNVQIIDRSK